MMTWLSRRVRRDGDSAARPDDPLIRRWTQAAARQPWWTSVLCIAVLWFGFLVAWEPQFHFWRDAWVHAAVLREWAAGDLLAPRNPHYLSDTPSREYTPWLLIFALLVKLSGMSPFDALRIAAAAGTVILYVGLHVFAVRFFETRLAGFIAVIAAFFFWGGTPEFVGFFNFRSQLFNNDYPPAAALGFALIIWAFTLGELRAPSAWRLAAIAALFALLMVIHQLTGGYALGGTVVLALFHAGTPWTRRLRVLAALVAGGLLCTLWPLYNPWHVVAASTNNDPEWAGPTKFERLDYVGRLLLPQLLGAIAFVGRRWARAMLPLTIGFAGCFGAYVVGALVGNPVTHRFLPLAAIFLSMGLVCIGLAALPGRHGWVTPLPPPRRGVALAALAGLAVLLTGLQAFAVVRDVYRSWAYDAEPIRDEIARVAAVIPPDDVAIATPNLALALTAFGIKGVAISRGLYLMPDEVGRRDDLRRFFSTTTTAERRAILARHHVRHVVFRAGAYGGEWRPERLDAAVVAGLRALGRTRDFPGHLVLVDLE